MYPQVVSTSESVADQRAQRCPFLSLATGERRECIKNDPSKGVCTINSASNGPRQDWVVCPYRAFDRTLLQAVAHRLYGIDDFHIIPAPVLEQETRQEEVIQLLDAGHSVLVYFDQKMGGEIGVSATSRSPEIAFDTTFVELKREGEGIGLGQFAVMEIQTMDFHGSYRSAVANLRDALRLHKGNFPAQVQANQRWLSERVEGPNIANVFKRTFWQMMFKFEMAKSPGCAGVALTLPKSVWDSWQKFLGAPDLRDMGESTYMMTEPDIPLPESEQTWIYVFDFDESSPHTPSPMRIRQMIRTSANAFAHYALDEAPRGAIAQLEVGIYPALIARLQRYWPRDFLLPQPDGPVGAVTIEEDPRPIDEIEAE